MIVPYFGEFLISPIPLELSFNFCSHRCAYCFANLNNPTRKTNDTKLSNLLAHYKTRSTLTVSLLQMDYPIIVSNRCDPFSKNNYQTATKALKSLNNLGMQVHIQTKGGHGIDEVLSSLPKSVWYISISTLDEAIRERVEPGAPSITERLQLIDTLTAADHPVIVGVNPLVPEWLPEPEPLLNELKSRNVHGVWIERLHLNYKQERAMHPATIAAITPDIIARARARYTKAADYEHFIRTRAHADSIGLNTYSVHQTTYSRIFDVFRSTYRNTFPVLQDFINLLHISNYTETTPITMQQWLDFIGSMLPTNAMPIAHYLGATSRDLWRRQKVPSTMTFNDMLKIIWNDPKTKYSPVKSPAFAYAATPASNGGWLQLTDEKQNPYLLFNKNGFDRYYHYV